MDRDSVIKNRKINPEDFLGKIYTPGSFVKDSFVRIFSLIYENFENDFKIENLFFDQDRFIVSLMPTFDGKVLDLHIKDNSGKNSCDGRFCTNNLCHGVHYVPGEKNFLKFLLSFNRKGVDISFRDLLKMLSKDIKAKKEYYQIFWRAENPFFSIIEDWGDSTHRMRFIAPEGVLREMDLELNISRAEIHHAERECKAIRPTLESDKEFNFFSYPREINDQIFDKYFYLDEKEYNKIVNSDFKQKLEMFTDLSEEDIIMGKGNEKLEKSINEIMKKQKKCHFRMIGFNCCCVPRVVGDDVHSILRKFEKTTETPFVYSGQLEKTPFEQKIGMLEEYLNRIEEKNLEVEENSIILFGYPENQYLKDLSEIIKEKGIKIKAIFVPNIDVDLLYKLYEAKLFVFSNNRFQEEIFEYPFKNMGKPSISPKYPFGVENTKEWIESIASSLGTFYSLSEYENNLIKTYYERVEYVKTQGYRVGLIFLGKQQLDSFLNPDYTNNVDVVEFLEEMGFGIDFFVYDEFDKHISPEKVRQFLQEEGDHKKIISTIKNKIDNFNKHNIYFFSNEEQMYKKIYNSKIDLIYSDIFFEDRSYKLGVNVFNIRVFREGHKGAVDTINTMIKLIEIDFLKKFGKYFN